MWNVRSLESNGKKLYISRWIHVYQLTLACSFSRFDRNQLHIPPILYCCDFAVKQLTTIQTRNMIQ